MEPKRSLTAFLIGSIAANLSPLRDTCQAIISSLKWSITAKSQAQPRPSIKNILPSVPHIKLGAEVVILLSCLCETFLHCSVLYGLSKLLFLMILRTRALSTEKPSLRSLYHIFLYPSPKKGELLIFSFIRLSRSESSKMGLRPLLVTLSSCEESPLSYTRKS